MRELIEDLWPELSNKPPPPIDFPSTRHAPHRPGSEIDNQALGPHREQPRRSGAGVNASNQPSRCPRQGFERSSFALVADRGFEPFCAM
jgi:hypothetical protein